MRNLLLAFICVSAASCTTSGQLVPTSGPLFQDGGRPIPTKLKDNGFGGGDVVVYMPRGEVCTGRFSYTVRDREDLKWYATQWQKQQYKANKTYEGSAFAVSPQGRSINMNFEAHKSGHGHGTARDNKGNTYQLTF